jgi:hypothetical protein
MHFNPCVLRPHFLHTKLAMYASVELLRSILVNKITRIIAATPIPIQMSIILIDDYIVIT